MKIERVYTFTLSILLSVLFSPVALVLFLAYLYDRNADKVFLWLRSVHRITYNHLLSIGKKRRYSLISFMLDKFRIIRDVKDFDKDAGTILREILKISLHSTSLNDKLDKIIDVILSFPGFSHQVKGCIFLVDKSTNTIIMTASRGLNGILLEKCNRLAPGVCYCGKSFKERKVIFSAHVCVDHTISYLGMENHGHFVLPINSSNRVVGVLNIYVNPGHIRTSAEDVFLDSVVTLLANIIECSGSAQRADYHATIDELTGIPNRLLFMDRLLVITNDARRTKTDIVLICVGIDDFKHVNDTYGYATGDLVLKEATKRIKDCIRSTDTLARVGGDEYAVILPRLTSIFYVEFVVRRILEEIQKPFMVQSTDDTNIFISASIGISTFQGKLIEKETLLSNATTAMRNAKSSGKGTFRFFEESMSIAAIERMNMEKDIRYGLENGEFVVYYQPKVQLSTGKVVGAEALTRWVKGGKVLGPSTFIPLAEQTGLIVDLGIFVVEEVCSQGKYWCTQGYTDLKLAINISAKQLAKHSMVVDILDASIRKTGFSAHNLEVEVTETVLMDSIEDSLEIINTIKEIGISVAIDDFGTGYSSLSYLQKLPIEVLKVDKSFIDDSTTDKDKSAIVCAIVSLSKDLNLDVVAEGVELKSQLDFLKSINCDYGQGYYFAKPMSAQKFEEYIKGKT